MPRSSNHCRNSPLPYVASAATDAGSRPCHWVKRAIMSRGHRFLTHPCCRRLYSHDHATVVVDQIVVVVSQPSRRAALGGVGRVRIGGRYLFLLMHWFFRRVLLF